MRWLAMSIALGCAAAGACSGKALLTTAGGGNDPSAGSDGSITTGAIANNQVRIFAGEPVNIYTLVARGAMACWFNPGGPLKTDYIFDAKVRSRSKGGAAEIVIHQRSHGSKEPRGRVAMRISIAKTLAGSSVTVVARRFPPVTARQMSADIYRWAAGGRACARSPAGEAAGTQAKPGAGGPGDGKAK